jgi:hypothetical protein
VVTYFHIINWQEIKKVICLKYARDFARRHDGKKAACRSETALVLLLLLSCLPNGRTGRMEKPKIVDNLAV